MCMPVIKASGMPVRSVHAKYVARGEGWMGGWLSGFFVERRISMSALLSFSIFEKKRFLAPERSLSLCYYCIKFFLWSNPGRRS